MSRRQMPPLRQAVPGRDLHVVCRNNHNTITLPALELLASGVVMVHIEGRDRRPKARPGTITVEPGEEGTLPGSGIVMPFPRIVFSVHSWHCDVCGLKADVRPDRIDEVFAPIIRAGVSLIELEHLTRRI